MNSNVVQLREDREVNHLEDTKGRKGHFLNSRKINKFSESSVVRF
jgi:hypothetical protein